MCVTCFSSYGNLQSTTGGDFYGWDGRDGAAYALSESDLSSLARTTFVLAADVVYDCAATEALVTLLAALLPRRVIMIIVVVVVLVSESYKVKTPRPIVGGGLS